MTDETPQWMSFLDESELTVKFHLENNFHENSISYFLRKDMELGQLALNKKKVYLDTKYWVYMREAAFGGSKDIAKNELYRLLNDAVKSGDVICPPSFFVLTEIFKNKSRDSRIKTAKVVENLSAGIALKPHDDLTCLETIFFLKKSWYEQSPLPPSAFAWTNCANVLGFGMPITEGVEEALMNALQKQWYDIMSKMPFSKFAESMNDIQNFDPRILTDDDVDMQNTLRDNHKNDFSNFEDGFLIELFGGLEAARSIIIEALLSVYKGSTGNDVDPVLQSEIDEGYEKAVSMIYQCFKLKKLTKELPGFRILAGLCAATRHKGQKYRANDIEDLFHARIALPYCDVFLTERSLCNLLSTPPLCYNELFDCKTAWKPDQAIAAIESIL